jgi:hypothetical protein
MVAGILEKSKRLRKVLFFAIRILPAFKRSFGAALDREIVGAPAARGAYCVVPPEKTQIRL